MSADEEPMMVDEKDTTPPPPEVEVKEEFPPYLPAIMGCRSVNEFHCLNKYGLHVYSYDTCITAIKLDYQIISRIFRSCLDLFDSHLIYANQLCKKSKI